MRSTSDYRMANVLIHSSDPGAPESLGTAEGTAAGGPEQDQAQVLHEKRHAYR